MKLVSIFIRPDTGYYCADYKIDKKLFRMSLKTKNRHQAEQNWHKFEDNYKSRESEFINEKQFEINPAFKEFIYFKQKNVQKSTFKSEIWKIKKFLNFIREENIKYVHELSVSLIKKFIAKLETEKSSPKTINNYLSIINTILKFFRDNEYMTKKIETSDFWKKKEKKRKHIINTNDAKLIIEYCKKIKIPRSRLLMIFPFYTGLRLSEIIALNRRNINLEEKYILICEKQTLADPVPTQIMKSINAFRKVPIISEFEPYLIEYLNQIKNNYIFQKTSYNTVVYHIQKINKNLDLTSAFNFHQARHFFASLLIDNNFSIKEVQTILGHEDVTTTLNIYGHLITNWDMEKFNKIKI